MITIQIKIYEIYMSALGCAFILKTMIILLNVDIERDREIDNETGTHKDDV
jgi:hypothetical protein